MLDNLPESPLPGAARLFHAVAIDETVSDCQGLQRHTVLPRL
jgi:hypothetical protein